jgi:hypothetical protein
MVDQKPLEYYYVGDEAFARFALAPDPILDAQIANSKRWDELVTVCNGDAVLARALVRVVGDDAVKWLEMRPQILEGMSGMECLNSPSGLARLKESLIRFPYL